MQSGFAWLDQDGNIVRKREELNRNEALASFLSDLEDHTSSWSEAKNRISALIQAAAAGAGKLAQERQERLDTADFQDLFWKGVNWEKYQRGQKYWPEGLSAVSQRHDAVICLGHYLWYGDPGAGLAPLRGRRNAARRAELISRWLESHHNGFSRAVNKGDWNPSGGMQKGPVPGAGRNP